MMDDVVASVKMEEEEVNVMPAVLVEDAAALDAMVAELANETRIAVDLESDGLYAYRAGLCLLQIAAEDGRVWLVDTLKLPAMSPGLAALLAGTAVIKVVHDVAFDARILGERDVRLTACHDTSIAARLLGRTKTGLATLLETELAVPLDKTLQTYDWRKRPLGDAELTYLAGDVRHLLALDDKLRAECEAREITVEVDEETQYRLDSAWEAANAPELRPAYVRMKGLDAVRAARDLELGNGASTKPEVASELSILRELAEVREVEAERRNVPPHKVLGNEQLYAMAAKRPRTWAELEKVRGLGPHVRALSAELFRAIERGTVAGAIPASEHSWFDKPRLASDEAKGRRGREAKLGAWRKKAAVERGVDEQVILPGHLSKAIAAAAPASEDALREIHGMSAARLARYGADILTALHAETEPTVA